MSDSERKTILRIRGWTYHLYRGRNGDRFCEKRDGLVRFTVQSLCEPEDNGTQVIDFQDKYALLDMMYDEANEYYKDNK